MQLIETWFAVAVKRLLVDRLGYALLLGAIIALFLLSVGTSETTLPFPPNSDYSDAVTSHYGNALYFQRSIQLGDFPLWRNLLMGGQPFAVNPLNKAWYPPQWLVVALPVTLHLNLLIWAHLVLGGLGMRAFGQATGLGLGLSNLLGVAYALTPRLIATVGGGHLDVVYAAGWLPVVMWATEGLLTGQAIPRRRGVIFGLCVGMCWLADLRISMFVLALAGSYLLYRWLTDRAQLAGWAVFRATVLGSGIALAVTATQWLPLLEVLPSLSRASITPAEASLHALEPLALLTLFIPRPPGFFEVMIYSGVLILITAVIGIYTLYRSPRRHLAIFAGIWIGLSLWYALGPNGGLWSALVTIASPLLWFRVPPRIWIIGGFVLLWMAAYGWQALLRTKLGRRPLLIIGMGALMLAELWWTDVVSIRPLPESDWLGTHDLLAQVLLSDRVTGVYSPTYSLPQQAAAYYDIPTFGGVDPFQLRGFLEPFQKATGTTINGYSVTLPPLEGDIQEANRAAVLNITELSRWHISHVVSAYRIESGGLRLVSTIQGKYVYRNTQLNARQELWIASNCVVGETLPLAGRYVSGWQRVTLPQGVGYCYAPPSQSTGMLISLLGLACAGLLWWRRGLPHS
jgi:hypothetical protein